MCQLYAGVTSDVLDYVPKYVKGSRCITREPAICQSGVMRQSCVGVMRQSCLWANSVRAM